MKSLQYCRYFWLIFYALYCSCLSRNVYADNSQISDTWHFYVAPYAWLIQLSGDVTVKGNTEDLFVTFKEIVQNSDGSAEGHIEGGYGPVTLMLDPTYLKVSKDFDVPIVKGLLSLNASATSEATLIDGGVFLRVAATTAHDASFELLGGARYLGLYNAISIPQLPSQFSVSDRENLTSPIVGGRLKYNPSEKAHIWLRGDIGGFHVDNVTLTWSDTMGFSYTVLPHLDIGAAYRTLGIDFVQPGKSAANIVIYGPLLGISFSA